MVVKKKTENDELSEKLGKTADTLFFFYVMFSGEYTMPCQNMPCLLKFLPGFRFLLTF